MKHLIRNALGLALLLPALAFAGPREEVGAAIDKFMNARSYHASMDMTGPQPMRSELDFVAPDRYRMRMGELGEQTIIGDTLYMTMQGSTMRLPIPQGTLTQWRDPARLAENARNMSVTALGAGTVNGTPAKKYRVAYTQPQASTMTLWVGPEGYPLQIVTDAGSGAQAATMTIRYSRFNDPSIRIDAPQ